MNVLLVLLDPSLNQMASLPSADLTMFYQTTWCNIPEDITFIIQFIKVLDKNHKI
jgi:hypothetical protein